MKWKYLLIEQLNNYFEHLKYAGPTDKSCRQQSNQKEIHMRSFAYNALFIYLLELPPSPMAADGQTQSYPSLHHFPIYTFTVIIGKKKKQQKHIACISQLGDI